MHHLTLWTVAQARACLADKLSRRPVSMTRRGFLKAGGKASGRDIAAVRARNLAALATLEFTHA
jgi:hypothetical protein